MRNKIFIPLLFYIIPIMAYNQVVNDDIQQAIRLEIGQAIPSKTDKSTIQSECINYALTKTCIKYHNDQWFILNPGSYDHLFLNIIDQSCRDLLGVQLVVLEGEACDAENYGLLKCISFGSNDDFYVKLEGLKNNTDYLVNIDGYLHDFCSFSIIADTVPYGMPEKQNLVMPSSGSVDSLVVRLKWHLPNSLIDSFNQFEVWRREEENFKHNKIFSGPVERNALGSIQQEYIFYDTLPGNITGYYKIFAVDEKGQKFLFGEHKFRGIAFIPPDYITIKLRYAGGEPLRITLFDPNTGNVFRKVRFTYDPLKHDILRYPVEYMLEQGAKSVSVEILDEKTGVTTIKNYRLR